jgi:hypothetical protein
VAVIADFTSSSAPDLAAEYARMAADHDREAEARAWANALLPDAFAPNEEDERRGDRPKGRGAASRSTSAG